MKRIFLTILMIAGFGLAVVSEAKAGNCNYSWQTDSSGRQCGDRAASRRSGGYEPPGWQYDR